MGPKKIEVTRARNAGNGQMCWHRHQWPRMCTYNYMFNSIQINFLLSAVFNIVLFKTILCKMFMHVWSESDNILIAFNYSFHVGYFCIEWNKSHYLKRCKIITRIIKGKHAVRVTSVFELSSEHSKFLNTYSMYKNGDFSLQTKHKTITVSTVIMKHVHLISRQIRLNSLH